MRVSLVALALGVLAAGCGSQRDTLDRLYEKGWIENPRSKAKSVVLTEEGLANSDRLFQLYFGGSNETLGEP